MRIGIFGGSFDPVHSGHLVLAEKCWEQADLDRVVFVPAAQQPFKPTGPQASNSARKEMLQLATAGRKEFLISTVELDRGGVSYTADTIQQYHNDFPGAELYLLMGADALADFPSWYRPDVICRLATLLVVSRAGQPRPDYSALEEFLKTNDLPLPGYIHIDMPAVSISSSQIRELLVTGSDWQPLVPQQVAEYICREGVYLDTT